MNGKTIRLYLVDGVPNGILTAEIINWTGKVVVALRSQLPGLKKWDDLKGTWGLQACMNSVCWK